MRIRENLSKATSTDEDVPVRRVGPLIAVLLPNQTNPYSVAMKEGFETAAADNGFKAEVQIAGDDDAQQLAQAASAMPTSVWHRRSSRS